MKALLKKDWYLLINYAKIMLVIGLLFSVVSGFQPDNIFIAIYPGLLISMLPLTLMSYDEREKWDRYVQTMPISRKDQMQSKYIIGLLLSTAVVMITTLSCGISSAVTGSFQLRAVLGLFLTLETMVLLPPTVMMPVIAKFGTEKGRLIYYAFIIIACGGAAGLSALGFGDVSAFSLKLSDGLLFAGIALLYIASMSLSVKFYERRELC